MSLIKYEYYSNPKLVIKEVGDLLYIIKYSINLTFNLGFFLIYKFKLLTLQK